MSYPTLVVALLFVYSVDSAHALKQFSRACVCTLVPVTGNRLHHPVKQSRRCPEVVCERYTAVRGGYLLTLNVASVSPLLRGFAQERSNHSHAKSE